MSAVPDKVLNWLYSVLTSEYHDINRTYSDIADSLSHYPSLSPRTEVYTYENGASFLLLLLSGTVPVDFRGTTYRFPIHLWVPHAYPDEAPLVYVTPEPNQGMVVRAGQHVGGDGRVYHPYLAQWGRYRDKSSILDFLSVLRGVFAKEPPVVSKQQQQQQQQQRMPPTQQPAPPPVPPPPEEWRRASQSPQMPRKGNGAGGPPPLPPKGEEGIQRQSSQMNGHRISSQEGPPLPPLPAEAHQNRSASPSWQANGHPQPSYRPQQQQPQRQSSLRREYPQDHQPQLHGHPSQRSQFATQQYELESPVSPITPDMQGHQSQQRYSQHPPPPIQQQSLPQQYSYQDPRHLLQQRQASIQPYPPHGLQHALHQAPFPQHLPQSGPIKQPTVDLLSSPLDVQLPSQSNQTPLPVPPVPPNPEKDALLTALSSVLVSQITQIVESNQAAVSPLRAQQAALRQAHGNLRAELDQLAQLDAALESNERILHSTMKEADAVMEDVKSGRRRRPEVDEVLVAPTVVGTQLYNLCAEERASEDARIVLARALDRGVLPVEVFIKQTRSLAREQFLKKALVRKIAYGMGLEDAHRL